MECINIIKKENYAIIEMDNGKVNAINTPLLKDLNQAFEELAHDSTIKGVILAGRPNCFSAGLDIVHLATGGIENLRTFWFAYFGLCRKMAHFDKPLVCAITGFAPAGGTILALLSDYRIMARGPKHVIGMHEFKLGLQIPELLGDIYVYHLGEKRAWEAVQSAKLWQADDAVKMGLVNEAAETADVLPRAEKYLQKLMRVPSRVYKDSKRYFQKDLRVIVNRDFGVLVDDIQAQSSTPEAKQMMEMFLQQLKAK